MLPAVYDMPVMPLFPRISAANRFPPSLPVLGMKEL